MSPELAQTVALVSLAGGILTVLGEFIVIVFFLSDIRARLGRMEEVSAQHYNDLKEIETEVTKQTTVANELHKGYEVMLGQHETKINSLQNALQMRRSTDV